MLIFPTPRRSGYYAERRTPRAQDWTAHTEAREWLIKPISLQLSVVRGLGFERMLTVATVAAVGLGDYSVDAGDT